ncbi:hypothetical protein GCM10023321_62910 [Pseudonocardia eucalypti]|uniref:Major facilitator superfamily (MFS) profile domain-containing protein n=1 Tax=Pseudonocardia eucalypti TaxID=648755 RepID=A0ABP9QW59_9PSEU|nr:hypothetical protein [Pseudonocardia eucalypti]
MGLIGLVAGLWVALPTERLVDGRRDRTLIVLGWLLAAASLVLIITGVITPSLPN